MPEASQKVAETAEITKTAPKLSPKARKKPAKTRQKVAEITINPKTAQKYEDYGIMVGFNYFTKKSPHISVQAPFEI